MVSSAKRDGAVIRRPERRKTGEGARATGEEAGKTGEESGTARGVRGGERGEERGGGEGREVGGREARGREELITTRPSSSCDKRGGNVGTTGGDEKEAEDTTAS